MEIQTKKSPKGIAIAIRAGMREAENELILDSLEHYYGHLGINTFKKISICQVDSLEDLLKKHQPTIHLLNQLGSTLTNETY